MTVIVGIRGKKGVLIAGDSQWSTPWSKSENPNAKVGYLRETVAFGYCGSGRFGQILTYHLDELSSPPLGKDELRWAVRHFIPKLRAATEDHGHLHIHHNVEEFGFSEFLLAIRSRLFTVFNDFSVHENVLPYEATGSGAEVALGSLHSDFGDIRDPILDSKLSEAADKAIAAATQMTPYVGGEVTTVKTVIYTAEEKALAKQILGL